MNALAVLDELQSADQDFEWYPTTRKMILAVARRIKIRGDRPGAILDIGAGTGGVFALLSEAGVQLQGKFAVEKSEPLLARLPADVAIIGTEFSEMTLIDKEVDYIFCNPPYSQYAEWAERIIREACVKQGVFLVLPERWDKEPGIAAALKRRGVKAHVEYHGDFLDAERQSRAKIEVLWIEFSNRKNDWKEHGEASDPFLDWVVDHFGVKDVADKDEEEPRPNERLEAAGQLVKGGEYVQNLVALYTADMEKLERNFRVILTLDADLMQELKVSVKALADALKQRVKGLKNLYWQEVFDRMKPLTTRLTSKSRQRMLEGLHERVSVDFTASNIYAVLLWAIKNANQYFQSQLLEVYGEMSERNNIVNYKSNKRLVEDGWRYSRKDMSHYRLDYRLVFMRHYTFARDLYSHYEFSNGLSKGACEFVDDIFTVAQTLGFHVIDSAGSFPPWYPGVERIFHMAEGDGYQEFARFRAYKNGNIHFRPCKDFMLALNIEAGRLNGWIKAPHEAMEEMDLTPDEVQAFGKLAQIAPTVGLKMIGCS